MILINIIFLLIIFTARPTSAMSTRRSEAEEIDSETEDLESKFNLKTGEDVIKMYAAMGEKCKALLGKKTFAKTSL